MIEKDIISLLDGTATIPYKIIINDEAPIILTENDIIRTTYEDYRYVDNDSLVIGQFVARTLEGELVNPNIDFTIENKDIEVQICVKTRNSLNWYSLGNFLVTKPSKDDVTDNTKFKAMDYTKKFNKVFDSTNITFPCTASVLAQSVCEQCGVELATTTFTNSDFLVTGNQYDSDDTCRKVMQDIGKLAYSWVRIGWDNKCYIDFNMTNTIEHYNKITNENYYELTVQKDVFGPVNRVTIGMQDVEGESLTIEDSESIATYGVTELKIYDNNLTYTPELREQVIDGAKRLFGLTYQPIEIDTTGHPWLLGNEKIQIVDMNNNNIYTYPFNRTIEYSGHIKTKLTATASTKTETDYKYTGGLENEIRKTRYVVDKQNQTITQFISNFTNLTTTASGTGKIKLDDVGNGFLLGFTIRGNMIPLFPRKNLYPNNALYPKPSEFYLMVKNNDEEPVKYKLNIPWLGMLDKTYDEFVYSYTDGVKLIRRLGIDENGDLYTLEEPIEEKLESFEIPLSKGNVEIYVEYYNVHLDVTYAISNEITDNFATNINVETQIKTTKTDITLESKQLIDKATSTDELIGKINISPGKIKLEGTVTANDNFKILTDGSIETKNGTFSGNIFLTNGGKIMGGEGLFTNLQFSSIGILKGWSAVGFTKNAKTQSAQYTDISLDCYIPENFTISNAYLTLYTSCVNSAYTTSDYQNIETIGKPTTLGLFKTDNDSTYEVFYAADTEYWIDGDPYMTEITNVFKTASYTPANTGVGSVDSITTIDIKDNIDIGRNQFIIRTKLNLPTDNKSIAENTGIGRAVLYVFGYTTTKIKEGETK